MWKRDRFIDAASEAPPIAPESASLSSAGLGENISKARTGKVTHSSLRKDTSEDTSDQGQATESTIEGVRKEPAPYSNRLKQGTSIAPSNKATDTFPPKDPSEDVLNQEQAADTITDPGKGVKGGEERPTPEVVSTDNGKGNVLPASSYTGESFFALHENNDGHN